MNLSVVLATYNEEQNITGCLESVRNWCQEIVVVDGSSSDKTMELAKKLGARVINADNPPLFHINKQKAIDAARGDWILQLDADERVRDDLKSEIEIAIKDKEMNGYWIPRKNYFLGRFLRKGGVYPDYTLRLYRRGKGKLPQKDVHEQAVVEGKTGYLKKPLVHLADMTITRYFLRFSRYTDLIASEMRRKSPTPTFFMTLHYLISKPVTWFCLTYFRHLGFMDSWQGFLFSLFSALRFPVAYLKYLRRKL